MKTKRILPCSGFAGNIHRDTKQNRPTSRLRYFKTPYNNTYSTLYSTVFPSHMRKTVSEVDYATKAIITFITDCLLVNELPQFVNFFDLLSPIYFNIESPEFTIQSKHNVICGNCLRVHWSWTPLCSIILYSVKSSISNFLVWFLYSLFKKLVHNFVNLIIYKSVQSGCLIRKAVTETWAVEEWSNIECLFLEVVGPN